MVLTGPMVVTILLLISGDLGAPLLATLWVMAGNLLANAVAVALGGPVTTAFGVRRSFLVGMIGLALGTALCAVAPNLSILIVGRVLAGAAGGLLPAVAAVSVTRLVPPGRRGPALGWIFGGMGIGATLGPIVGGLGAEIAGWRAPFILVLILCLPLIAAGKRMLPDDRTGDVHRFDLIGGVLLSGAIGLALFGVTTAQLDGSLSASVVGCWAGSVAAGALLWWRIRSAPAPLFRPTIFTHRGFTIAAAIGFLAQLCFVTCNILVPILLGMVGHLSPGLITAVVTPGSVIAALVSPPAGHISDRIGPKKVIVSALIAIVCGALWLSSTAAGDAPGLLTIGLLLLGAGFGLMNAPLADAAAGAVGRADAGDALGLYQACWLMGAACAPALAGGFVDESGARSGAPINPLHIGSIVTTYSDGFLVAAAIASVALAVSFVLRKRGHTDGRGVRAAPRPSTGDV